MATCGWCEDELSDRQVARGTRFCSKSCANRYRYKNVKREFVCQNCGRVYIKKNTGTKVGTKYCGRECARAATVGVPKSAEHRRKISEANSADKVRVEGQFDCECGRTFGSNTALRAHKAHCGRALRDVRCFKCGRSFKGLAALRLHQMWCLDTERARRVRRRREEAARIGNLRRVKAGNERTANTDIERLLADALDLKGIRYEKQFQIGDSGHCFDFYVFESSTLVEADGDYWHGNPEMFAVESRHKRQFRIDQRHSESARKAGFRVLRYWGSDIKANVEAVVAEICGTVQVRVARSM